MQAHAIEAAEVMAFTQENKASNLINSIKNLGGSGKGGQIWRFFVNSQIPFSKIPANIGKAIYKGALGAPEALIKTGVQAATGKLTNEDWAKNAMDFGRGTVGMGLIAAGYAAAANGKATGHLQDEQKKGAIKIGDHWFRIGLIPPAGALFSLGASLYELKSG